MWKREGDASGAFRAGTSVVSDQCSDRDGEAPSSSNSSAVANQMAILGPGSPFRGPPFTTELQIKNRGEPGIAC